jgi:hypothetical protein
VHVPDYLLHSDIDLSLQTVTLDRDTVPNSNDFNIISSCLALERSSGVKISILESAATNAAATRLLLETSCHRGISVIMPHDHFLYMSMDRPVDLYGYETWSLTLRKE